MDALFFRQLQCPSCGEPIEIQVDSSAGDQGYIEDCGVWCRPIEIRVYLDGDDWGLQVRRDDE